MKLLVTRTQSAILEVPESFNARDIEEALLMVQDSTKPFSPGIYVFYNLETGVAVAQLEDQQ